MSANTSTALDVLIIDDDDLMRERLEVLLDANGLGALGVGTLAQAREALKAIYFPVIILDRGLADGDGLELCRSYRDAHPTVGTAIIMLSSKDSQQSIDAGLAAGADDYISKSVGDDELLARIKNVYKAQRATPQVEAARLESLQSYAVMDSLPEQAFDDIVRLASFICKAPIALISLIDDKRQWFKARVGLDATETAREYAFCAHAMLEPQQVMVVTDATQDKRFATNPLVTGGPGIRFYAGAPLISPDGFPLGTVCVIDDKPRTLGEDEAEALLALSRQTVLLMEQRKANMQRSWADHIPGLINLVRSISQQRCSVPHTAPCPVCETRALIAKTESALAG